MTDHSVFTTELKSINVIYVINVFESCMKFKVMINLHSAVVYIAGGLDLGMT